MCSGRTWLRAHGGLASKCGCLNSGATPTPRRAGIPPDSGADGRAPRSARGRGGGRREGGARHAPERAPKKRAAARAPAGSPQEKTTPRFRPCPIGATGRSGRLLTKARVYRELLGAQFVLSRRDVGVACCGFGKFPLVGAELSREEWFWQRIGASELGNDLKD